jgi:membrane-bound metal-dependent hydrolase YbcI (DUF457 family)
MFVGHYGPSFAGKSLNRAIPLWVLFLAVQWLDVVWSILVLLGVEKVRIVPGITKTNPLDLYYMPYTHSLVAAVLWAIGAGFVYRRLRKGDGMAAAGIVGAAVFSHWVLDLVVHRPDLALYDDTLKMGLGLWNYPAVALAVEVVLLFGGMYFYLAKTRSETWIGRYGMVILGLIMLFVQTVVFFGPPPPSDRAAAITALLSYFVFALSAGCLESRRSWITGRS